MGRINIAVDAMGGDNAPKAVCEGVLMALREMKDIADFMVRIPVRTKWYLEDEIDSCQPMTSLFEQSVLLLGDVLAKMIIEERQLDMKSLWQYHANLE